MMHDAQDDEMLKPMLKEIRSIVQSEVKRIDGLLDLGFAQVHQEMQAERLRINEQMDLRAKHQAEMSLAESKRIDANRDGDMKAVALANDRAIQQASILANQVSSSAETLRGLVASTATAAASQWGQVTEQITTRLLALETARYESRGAGSGTDKTLGWVFGFVMAVAALGTLVFAIMKTGN